MVIELRIPPNINPTSGIKITFRYLILSTILRKTILAKKVSAKAKSVFTAAPACGKKISEANIPIFAASNVPAVVGETNLFCVICCIISPQILSPTPAKINAIVLGTLLIAMVNNSSSFHWKISARAMSFTPTKREMKASKIKAIIK